MFIQDKETSLPFSGSLHWIVKICSLWSQAQPATVDRFRLVEVGVGQQMQLPRFEAVLTFAFVKNVRLEFPAWVFLGSGHDARLENADLRWLHESRNKMQPNKSGGVVQ